MLHILALVYFVALLSAAVLVIAGMLLANREHILAALGIDDVRPAVSLPVLRERPPVRARVVRMASPAPAWRMAA
jgi:hypothetical protein